MATRIDRERLDAWRSFLGAHALVLRALEEELQGERGLPLAFYEVLYRLQKAPDGWLQMNELADSLVVSRSGLTRMIDRMAADGLIERAECPTDRRGRMAVITAKGRRALRDASPIHMRGIKDHFTDLLTDTEARTLRRALDRVVSAAREGKAERVKSA